MKVIKLVARAVVPVALVAVVSGCSSATSGSPGSTTASAGSPSVSGSPSSGSPSPSAALSAPASQAAAAFVRALFVDRNAAEAVAFVDPGLRSQARASAQSEIKEFGATDRFEVGTPTGTPADAVVPVTNVSAPYSSYKVHLSLAPAGRAWLVNGYRRADWDAGPRSTATSGPNPPFTCTPGFVTTLHEGAVAPLVAHYPVPDLTPEADVATPDAIRNLRTGELDVVYSAHSTGLPRGPSKSMYLCYVRYVTAHGWRPDREMNAIGGKHPKPGDPLSTAFFDSGSRYKGGNELEAVWFTSEQAFGHGNQLEIHMTPHGFLPDLPPPPK